MDPDRGAELDATVAAFEVRDTPLQAPPLTLRSRESAATPLGSLAVHVTRTGIDEPRLVPLARPTNGAVTFGGTPSATTSETHVCRLSPSAVPVIVRR
jgi:hypothetical protein